MLRVWLVVGCLFLTLSLATEHSAAQDNQVRVGVTVLGSAAGITGTAGRDRLVKALNKQKKSHVEAIPIDATTSDQISPEARQKNCVFLLFTTQTEAHNEGGASGKPGQTTNIPEYHATVEYKLYRVADSTVAASGSAVAQDIGSEGDVVLQALDNVAKKVSANINNAGTTK